MVFVENEQPFAHDKSSQIDVGVFPSRAKPGEITGKRPLLDDDEHQLFGCKRTKQVEQDSKKGSFLLNAVSGKSFSAMHDDDSKAREIDSPPEKFSAKWTSSHCSDSDEENQFPSYVDNYKRLSGYNHFEESYEPFFDRFPVKPVPIGPNHQAEIPEWRPKSYRSTTRNSNDDASAIISANRLLDDKDEDDSDRWLGTCIMPMPNSAILASDATVLQGKTGCSCFDKGSIRCARQHVTEAREELEKALRHDRFRGLGFTNMGEDVAEDWTEEEEQLFHEVIFSNPASLKKNFWYVLARVFHTRTTKDLVSYYFNVFMLRKRAEQNRSDPLNPDSDNDEWEDEVEEEDEDDSAIESLEDQAYATDHKDDQEEFDGDEGAENEVVSSVSEPFVAGKSIFFPSPQQTGRILDNCAYEHDVQDDSCTSFEEHVHAPVDMMDEFTEYNDNLGEDQELLIYADHCDPKAWGLAFTFETKKDDFLSTCSVIEEVCGKDHQRKSR